MFGLEVGGRWDELELQTKLCAAGLAPALSEPSLTPDGKRATAAPRPGPPVAAGSVVGSDCVRRWQKEKPRSWHCPWGKRLGCVLHIFGHVWTQFVAKQRVHFFLAGIAAAYLYL